MFGFLENNVSKLFKSKSTIVSLIFCLITFGSGTPSFAEEGNLNTDNSVSINPSDTSERIKTPAIVGGGPVYISFAPWQVAIVMRAASNDYDGQFCGGTLITTQWIVTAAHCVSDSGVVTEPSALGIVAGRSTLSLLQNNSVPVSSIIVHPSYNSSTMANDIALMQLSTPLSIRQGAVEPIPILRTAVPNNKAGKISGWGQTGMTTDYGYVFGYELPAQLQGTTVWISDDRCWGSAPAGFMSNLMLCAGTSGWFQDACQGDSGGPLATEVGGQYYLAGVTSWGEGCAWLTPGIYTKVSRYAQWIDENADNNQSELDFATTSEPVISGAAIVGQILTASISGWDPEPTAVTYQWFRSGSTKVVSSGASYKLTTKDLGKSMTVRATASRSGYISTTITSFATNTVAEGIPFDNSPNPIISGSAVVGQTLTASIIGWEPLPTTLTYQWFRSGSTKVVSTRASYKLTSKDRGKTMTVRVRGIRSGYISTSVTSLATDTVL